MDNINSSGSRYLQVPEQSSAAAGSPSRLSADSLRRIFADASPSFHDIARISRCSSALSDRVRIVSRGVESAQGFETLDRQLQINYIELLLLWLSTKNTSLEHLLTAFTKTGSVLFDPLCDLVCKVHEAPRDNPAYGEVEIKKNPRILLNMLNAAGDNPIEFLIRELRDHPLDECASKLLRAEFRLCEQGSSKLADIMLLIESYYEGLAEHLTKGFNFKKSSLDFDLLQGDENLAFEVAKILAAQDGKWVSRNIRNFGFKSQEKLVSIAKISAAQDGQHTSFFITNYGITNEAHRFEIAMIAAGQSGSGVSGNIDKYGFTDQNYLFSIAMRSAAQNGPGTSYFIHSYGIVSEESRCKVAQCAVHSNPLNSSEFIERYELWDEANRFEVAKCLVARNWVESLNYLPMYDITNLVYLSALAHIIQSRSGA